MIDWRIVHAVKEDSVALYVIFDIEMKQKYSFLKNLPSHV